MQFSLQSFYHQVSFTIIELSDEYFPWQSFVIWSDLTIFFKKYSVKAASIPLCQLQFAELNSTFNCLKILAFKASFSLAKILSKGYSYLNMHNCMI
ncbi:unnamed protein product [Blepharisma stoltei]|uniref:Uncharacterized protein n=1 Tax=Blepharisma stoltei TaxID=1481888 RepID=A0AAU9JRU7_9CILI|nr:unnamed protein product [Blepharisma stoltei]